MDHRLFGDVAGSITPHYGDMKAAYAFSPWLCNYMQNRVSICQEFVRLNVVSAIHITRDLEVGTFKSMLEAHVYSFQETRDFDFQSSRSVLHREAISPSCRACCNRHGRSSACHCLADGITAVPTARRTPCVRSRRVPPSVRPPGPTGSGSGCGSGSRTAGITCRPAVMAQLITGPYSSANSPVTARRSSLDYDSPDVIQECRITSAEISAQSKAHFGRLSLR